MCSCIYMLSHGGNQLRNQFLSGRNICTPEKVHIWRPNIDRVPKISVGQFRYSNFPERKISLQFSTSRSHGLILLRPLNLLFFPLFEIIDNGQKKNNQK